MAELFPLHSLLSQGAGSQEDEDTEVEAANAKSQIVLFVIDTIAFLKDQETFDAVRCAVLKKLLDVGYQPNSKNCRAGIVFYGGDATKAFSADDEQAQGNQAQGNQGVFWLRSLSEAPDGELVNELDQADLVYFTDILQPPTEQDPILAAEGLRNVISEVAEQVGKAKNKKTAEPVTVFMTADPDPLGALPKSRADMEGNFRKIRHDSFLMVCPLVDRKGVFLEDGPWAGLQKLAIGARPLEACTLQTLHEDMESRWPVRKAPFSRRVHFHVSERLQLPLKVYKLTRPAAKTPSYKYMCSGGEPEELTSHSAFVHDGSGLTLKDDEIRQAAVQIDEKNALVTTIPETIVVGREAAVNVAAGQGHFGHSHPSLHLLHFTPTANLKLHHQKAGSKFAVVDPDKDDAGLAAERKRLYFALWDVMLNTKKMAVCVYKGSDTTAPKLVALCAEDCILDDNGVQLQPEGFVMHDLPYADEIRSVAVDRMVVHPAAVPNAPPTVAPKAAVAAAEALIDAMSDDAVTCFTFTNDEARFAAEVFKTLILLTPDQKPNMEEFNCTRDYLERQATTRPVPVSVLDGFVDQVLDGSKVDNDNSTAGKKRAAPAAPKVSDAEIVQHTNWADLIKRQKLSGLTNAQLQAYCRHHKLTASGRKADLVSRIESHAKTS